MTNSEIRERKEVRKIEASEAIAYLTAVDRHPVLQVMGEYIRAAEFGEFNQAKVLKNIQEHLTDLQHAHPHKKDVVQLDPNSFFNGSVGYINGEGISRLYTEFEEMPDAVRVFLSEYTTSLNVKIKNAFEQVSNTPEVQRIQRVLFQLLDDQEAPADRLLRQSEKDRHIRQEFLQRTGREFAGGADKQDPVYVRSQRYVEFATMPQTAPQNEGITREELTNTYVRLMRSLYNSIKTRTDPTYNPLTVQFGHEITLGGYIHLLITDAMGTQELSVYELFAMFNQNKLSDPNLYVEALSQYKLITLIESYIYAIEDAEEKVTVVGEITEALGDPTKFLSNYELISSHRQVTAFFGELIKWIQITEKIVWEAPSAEMGFFGKAKNGVDLVSLLVKNLRNQKLQTELFSGFAATDQDLTSLFSYLKKLFKVSVAMTGHPLHVMRFPQVVSVFKPESMSAYSNFIDYREFVEDRSLSPQVTVRNQVAFQSQDGEEGETKYVYLALPQYAPVASLAISSGNEAEKQELIIGKDFQLEYQKKTGHYRVKLLSQTALDAGRKGIKYVAGVDFIDQQKELPKKVNAIELPSEKIGALSEALRNAGFDRLAERLQETLQPHFLKRVRLQLTGQDARYSSDDVTRAIRDSVYYSFATPGSTETKIAHQIVSAATDGELDFSFLPQVVPDKASQARIRVQCGHVAELYAVIMNYLLTNEGKSSQLYASSLFADPTEGVTTMMGFRLFGIGHADTRGVVTDSNGQVQQFQEDLTPSPSIATARDAVRSAFSNIKQVSARLNGLKKSLDSNVPAPHHFYQEISSNEKSFNEYILQLKREAGEHSQEFHKNLNELDNFIQAEPGIYRSPDELMEIMKAKPLAAVINILLFLQDKGSKFIQLHPEVEYIKEVLSTLKEWFQLTQNRENTPHRVSEEEKEFINELSSASGIGEKLQVLIESLER